MRNFDGYWYSNSGKEVSCFKYVALNHSTRPAPIGNLKWELVNHCQTIHQLEIAPLRFLGINTTHEKHKFIITHVTHVKLYFPRVFHMWYTYVTYMWIMWLTCESELTMSMKCVAFSISNIYICHRHTFYMIGNFCLWHGGFLDDFFFICWISY